MSLLPTLVFPTIIALPIIRTTASNHRNLEWEGTHPSIKSALLPLICQEHPWAGAILFLELAWVLGADSLPWDAWSVYNLCSLLKRHLHIDPRCASLHLPCCDLLSGELQIASTWLQGRVWPHKGRGLNPRSTVLWLCLPRGIFSASLSFSFLGYKMEILVH